MVKCVFNAYIASSYCCTCHIFVVEVIAASHHRINSLVLFPSGVTSESHVAVSENNHSSFRTTCWSASGVHHRQLQADCREQVSAKCAPFTRASHQSIVSQVFFILIQHLFGLLVLLTLITVFIFTLNSFTVAEEEYSYIFQVCGDAGGVKGAGLVQQEKKTGKHVQVGCYNQTRAIKGSM